jgi:uncharacterized repeat protein (TIGR01451 family)
MTIVRNAKFASLLAVGITATFLSPVSPPAHAAPSDDTPVLLTPKGEHENESEGQNFDKLRDAYYWSRLLSGDDPITLSKAADLRAKASRRASAIPKAVHRGATRGGTWTTQGPDPIVQVGRTSNTFEAVSGRIGALAIRRDGTLILGAAQGGVWTYDATSGTWTPRTADTDTQSVGALAIAPSNDRIVYMGSGEGALSGDSYYGDGIYRSDDGGVTWQHVSSLFTGQAVSDLAVDPKNPRHLYASTLRGRGGNHRTTHPSDEPYGVWESHDAGAHWTLRKGTTDEIHGATDLVMDPRNAKILWASFWGDGIYRSTNGGKTWHSALGDLPKGNFLEGGTRFSLGISHPAGARNATVYTGFDYFDNSDTYHQAQVYKTTTDGDHWTATATGSGSDSVLGYCTTQCFYDNEVKPDPANPDIVYVLGSYGYSFSPPSGGVFRSTDGGRTWKNLGYDLHPDFHAIAFQPGDTAHVAIGNDGGVWQSHDRGGRLGSGDPLSSVDWENLNGDVDPNTAALVHSTGLAITQFTSIATVPQVPDQYWGGSQDNGTERKSVANSRWFDQAGGDGGQVIVDQTTVNQQNPTVPAYVFGTYFDISPYRFDPSETNTFFGNETIDGGIDLNDRAEFYVPWAQNRGNVNQMFLGTYRMYRSDNVEAPSAGDVHFDAISGDLTSGCTGPAPNGARGCFISAVGLADGGTGVYAGTDEGWIQVSPDAVSSDTPSWHRVGAGRLPNRPVNQIAVDRSNWRIAYAAYGGFDSATPGHGGHLFSTRDGGRHWLNATGNLPDVPVNTVVIDPSNTDIVAVGTDVGPFVSINRGRSWDRLGNGIPKVAIWQLDYDPSHGVLAAGTHGRGAYTIKNRFASPALVVSKADTGRPVGPGSSIDYTITVKNLGNADATQVRVSDPVPRHTSFVSASDGGGLTAANRIVWQGLTVPAGGSVSLHATVRISPDLPSSVTSIVDDGLRVSSAQHVGTTGSPHTTAIAPAHGVSVDPTSGLEGARVGQAASFREQVTNEGYQPDTFDLSTSGQWSSSTYDASCTTPMSATPQVQPGDSTTVCVKVQVPASAADDSRQATTFTATSQASPQLSATSHLTTIAVASDTVLVDEDTNDPVDSAPYYRAALSAAGITFGSWDLSSEPELPQSYLTAHRNVVWFTGNSYPGPITPYESELKALLDGGGRLFLSGQDILDQAAGTTAFVRDYLHVSWDGSEAQNDKATNHVTAVSGNPVTDGLGTVALDHSVLQAAFEDEITPISPATAAFTDDSGATDALTVADGSYKVAFLAFPFEGYGTAAQRASLMGRAFGWFGTP